MEWWVLLKLCRESDLKRTESGKQDGTNPFLLFLTEARRTRRRCLSFLHHEAHEDHEGFSDPCGSCDGNRFVSFFSSWCSRHAATVSVLSRPLNLGMSWQGVARHTRKTRNNKENERLRVIVVRDCFCTHGVHVLHGLENLFFALFVLVMWVAFR